MGGFNKKSLGNPSKLLTVILEARHRQKCVDLMNLQTETKDVGASSPVS